MMSDEASHRRDTEGAEEGVDPGVQSRNPEPGTRDPAGSEPVSDAREIVFSARGAGPGGSGGLPGDIDGDGDVDFADVTAALASGDFSKVTASLANFGAREFRLTIDPGVSELREAVFSHAGLRYEAKEHVDCEIIENFGGEIEPWSNARVPNRLDRAGLALVSWELGPEQDGFVPKVAEPRTGTPKDRRWLRLSDCKIKGTGGSVPVAEVGQWGGGVFLDDCCFRGVKACVPNAAAHVDGFAEDLTSDFCSNARAVVRCRVDGIRKPEGTDFHPDLWQQSWPAGSKVGPLLIDGLRALGIHAQAFFINSPDVVIPAVYVRDYDVECTPDNGYKAQIRSPIGLLVFDGFRLINQDLSIRRTPDGSGGFIKTIGRCIVRRGFKVITKQGIDASEAVIAALKSISETFSDERA